MVLVTNWALGVGLIATLAAAVPAMAQTSVPVSTKNATMDRRTPNEQTQAPPSTTPRSVNVPGKGRFDYATPMALQPRDTRTPRQRCVDEEVKSAGGSPTNRLRKKALALR